MLSKTFSIKDSENQIFIDFFIDLSQENKFNNLMKTSLRTCSFMLLICVISFNNANAQFFDKIIKEAKQAKGIVTGTKHIAKEVTGATNEISNTVKTLKQSWKKDSSPNINCKKNPDYRNRTEVDINKRQELIL